MLVLTSFSGMAHVADLAGGSIAGVEFTIHTDGDNDQVPSDSDKNVPHHHNYCHGHDVGAPARTTMEYTHVLTMPKPTISASASLDGRTGMVHMSDIAWGIRSEEHTSELQSLMRHSYAVFCLKQNKNNTISIKLT